MTEKEEDISDDELDDLLDKTFEKQDMIHKKCEIRNDPVKKQKQWDKKYK